MIFDYTDYRAFLDEHLRAARAKNPAYSLRAMARQLECAPSTLSEILLRKKNLSTRQSLAMAMKLGLSSEEAEYFQALVELDRASDPEAKDHLLQKMRALNPSAEIRNLSVDRFQAIAEWHHIPLIELTRLKDFKLTAATAARALGLAPFAAQRALDRLVGLELLACRDDGTYRRAPGSNVFGSESPSEALRAFHGQALERAQASLRAQSPAEKFVGSETFALDPTLLPKAKRLSDRYLTALARLSKESADRRCVYQAVAVVFRVTPQKA